METEKTLLETFDGKNIETKDDNSASDVIDKTNSDVIDKTSKMWRKKKQSFLDSDNTHISIFVQAAVIILTSFMRAIAYDIFVVPNKIAPGGIAGLSSIFYNINNNLSVGLTSAVMNIPLIVLAFLFINKKFAVSTLIAVILTSVLTEVMKNINFVTFTGDLFVAGLVGGALNGVALGILLKINCSTGGTDIMGLLIQNKLPDIKISWIIFIFNAVVSMIAGIVFRSLEIAIYSLVSIFATSFASDFIQKGFVSSVEFKIFTSLGKEKILADYVINVLGHSVTMVPATGMYRGTPVCYLICIVRKRQAPALKKAIINIDSEAFLYVTSVSAVLGRGFLDNNVPHSKL